MFFWNVPDKSNHLHGKGLRLNELNCDFLHFLAAKGRAYANLVIFITPLILHEVFDLEPLVIVVMEDFSIPQLYGLVALPKPMLQVL